MTAQIENTTETTSNDDAILASMENMPEMADIEDLDDLEDVSDIDELDAAADEIDDTETVEAASDDIDPDEIEDLEVQIERAENYAAQSGAPVATVSKEDIKSKGVAKAGSGSKTPRGPSTPRAARDLSTIDAKHFVLTGDVSAVSTEDQEAARKSAIDNAPKQKKVAEKYEGVFVAMAAGSTPSKYVMTAFQALEAKGGAITSAELIAAFRASGVGDGTARSQTGQIMVLFDALKIANRSGKALNAVADSNIANYLRSHIAA